MKKFRVPQEAGIFGVVLIVGAIMALLSPAFLTMNNMQVLLLNGTVVLFLAMGQTFVLLTGGMGLRTVYWTLSLKTA